jgi:hypothetical protein
VVDERDTKLRRPYLAFRTVTGVQVITVLAQAVFAGGFLSGHYAMLDMHKTTASAIAVAALLQVVAGAFLLRAPGRPRWPLYSSIAIFLMIGAQIPLGMARVLILHVSLAVIIISGVALTAWRAWQPAGPATAQILGEDR